MKVATLATTGGGGAGSKGKGDLWGEKSERNLMTGRGIMAWNVLEWITIKRADRESEVAGGRWGWYETHVPMSEFARQNAPFKYRLTPAKRNPTLPSQ